MKEQTWVFIHYPPYADREDLMLETCDGYDDLNEEVWAVGFFMPNGKFMVVDTTENINEAMRMVHYLNGGN